MKSKRALNNKYVVEGIFCNLENASNCVNHDILLSKLELYGITGRDPLGSSQPRPTQNPLLTCFSHSCSKSYKFFPHLFIV